MLDFRDFKRKAWTTVLVDRGAQFGKDRLKYTPPAYLDNASAARLLMDQPGLLDHRLYQWDGRKWVDVFNPGREPHQYRF